ncbi:aminoacyl-tRNA hydrolase [Mesorhizobium sp. M1B.F.Ca.ET.045.04.1.1]|uniref:aminoacyl-tRNA hydrolase n=1 Tax=Mesorhizobium sp. M1B.F.Ca.ET.045.04.1.1 TaxID=2493673 RepID=UPI000F75FB20|nr:aminoacyl-tRNA hydrolase [Mesorhizobium sp. M1B.F.Ca.ET.045.04.1.1]AZO29394.1 hypothetical protein EJ071_19705 [Mesorhizobium sp. M1B.F.Ca.ET.045.04.1.1]
MTSSTDELRIAVIFRADIDIPRGKGEVQFGHAVALLVHGGGEVATSYMAGLQMKLSMEVDDLDAIALIMAKAKARGVPFAVVEDAGRTVFGEPTITCIGLGPMNKTDCNALTRNARMRK